jgi:hypothetical protein
MAITEKLRTGDMIGGVVVFKIMKGIKEVYKDLTIGV